MILRCISCITNVIFLLVTMSVSAFAGSGSFSSTYEMSGGLGSRQFEVGDGADVTVKITPSTGISGSDISITLYRRGWGNIEEGYAKVSSTSGGTVTFKDVPADDDYYVYLYCGTGRTIDGGIKVSWTK